jgi:pyruvate,water dikinase
VTVDAEENVVYEGRVSELLRYHLSSQQADADFDEFRHLKRILKTVAPLNMNDPDSEEFRARSCRTYHDMIRFAHEMAVRELIEMPGLSPKERARYTRRLRLEIPMDLDVLDIGGGIAPAKEEMSVTPDCIRSAPLVAMLEGLCAPGAWSTEAVGMDTASLISSATGTTPYAMGNLGRVRPNLAVVSEDYLNLHLLLGYHFNMVDCSLSGTAAGNYIYFRFIGGMTDITKRSRRARSIAAVLQNFGFDSEAKGDLVIGRIRNVGPEEMRVRLQMLGRLIGFSRQLDVLMRDEDTVRERAREFIEQVLRQGQGGKNGKSASNGCG